MYSKVFWKASGVFGFTLKLCQECLMYCSFWDDFENPVSDKRRVCIVCWTTSLGKDFVPRCKVLKVIDVWMGYCFMTASFGTRSILTASWTRWRRGFLACIVRPCHVNCTRLWRSFPVSRCCNDFKRYCRFFGTRKSQQACSAALSFGQN